MRSLIGIALVAALAAGAVWYFMDTRGPGSTASVNAATSAPAAITVEAGPVKLSAVRRQIEAVGSLRSNESVIIRPEIAGRITEILFDEGQQVRKGMPLIRLDAAIARAQLEQAKASLVLSRANHERAEDLYRRGAGTQRARDEGVAKLHADEAAVALAQATLDKSTLRGALRRHARPAPRQRRRLRQSRPGSREPREHRVAEGRFPRARDPCDAVDRRPGLRISLDAIASSDL